MHPITVRTLQFDVPSAADFDPLYLAGSPALSYNHTAFGLYVAHLEPFAVKSLRRVLDRVRDDALREAWARSGRTRRQRSAWRFLVRLGSIPWHTLGTRAGKKRQQRAALGS